MSKYIKVEDLQKFCDNSKDHSITPNEFQRMTQIELPDEHGILVEKTEITKKMLHLVNNKDEHFFALKVEDYNNLPAVLEASK